MTRARCVTDRATPGLRRGRLPVVASASRASGEQCTERIAEAGLDKGDVVPVALSVSAVTCEARGGDDQTQQGQCARRTPVCRRARRMWSFGSGPRVVERRPQPGFSGPRFGVTSWGLSPFPDGPEQQPRSEAQGHDHDREGDPHCIRGLAPFWTSATYASRHSCGKRTTFGEAPRRIASQARG
jgi:hypothetical protein